MKKITTLFVIGMLASASSIALAKNTNLSLSKPMPVDYQCNDGSKIKATYYDLSDDSLAFVKLTIKDQAYTLPHVISASGVRYTDMNIAEWWTKGSDATLDGDVNDDKSKLVECKEITTSQKK